MRSHASASGLRERPEKPAHFDLWSLWLAPYSLSGHVIVPPDAVPTPFGIQKFDDWHEQLRPNVYDSREGISPMRRFRPRRDDTATAVHYMFQFDKCGNHAPTPLEERLKAGGTVWFGSPPCPHEKLRRWYRHSMDPLGAQLPRHA